MKPIVYEDEHGYIWQTLVKDDDEEEAARYGIPIGPPDVRLLDWDMMMKQINNELSRNGAFTWNDLQRQPVAMQSAMNVLKRHLIDLYRQDHSDKKQLQK